jgi:tetratricopeptide (TPR) repeat protein
MRTEPELEAADALAAGHEALSRGEWEQALAYFEAASEQSQSAEAIEALAMAAWWLDNARLAIESRETAFCLYRERGDAAARIRARWSIVLWYAVVRLGTLEPWHLSRLTLASASSWRTRGRSRAGSGRGGRTR